MLDGPFDEIQKAHIDALIANEVIEHKQLDYKRDLPGGTDQEKIEFLADVSSFANASGGHIIYGLGEKKDESGKNTGTPEYVGLRNVNVDEQKIRLEQIIQSGVAQRIPSIQIKEITGFGNGPVIIIQIPKSWAAPHMVTFKNHSRFYSRTSAGKQQLDVGEIRAAFVLSETLPERIRQFRSERIGNILADETPIKVPEGPKIVLHLIPWAAFNPDPRATIDISNAPHLDLMPIYSSGQTHRYNLDGLLTFD
jgi:hypothetical protein